MGASVILNGRNMERLNETLGMMKTGNHVIMAADLSKQEEIEMLVNELPEIQGWVNSAGMPKICPIKRFKLLDIEEIMSVNTISSMMLLSFLLKIKKLKEVHLLFLFHRFLEYMSEQQVILPIAHRRVL